jgi:hypothetical protein
MSARTFLRCILAFLAALLLSVSANAQLFRAYLAPTGSDSNPCTLPAPCRLLPAALAAVADGGEIWMLDSANYNTASVTIGKSVSILAVPGAVGSMVAAAGPAISIGAAGLTIALRNLVIVPLAGGGGTHGVSMTGASTLFIENSVIANLSNNGVYVFGTGKVKITNSIIRNNANFAVRLENGASGEISGTQMLASGNGGVYAYSTTATTTIASVNDSVISGGSEGVLAYTTIPGAVASIFVSRSTIESTYTALDSQTINPNPGSSLVTVSGSTITNNTNSYNQAGVGAVIESAGNNHIRGNTNTSGTLTIVGLQ